MKTVAFNIEEFKNGRVATNSLAQKVTFMAMTRNKMLVKVESPARHAPCTKKYNLNGKLYDSFDSVYDLTF